MQSTVKSNNQFENKLTNELWNNVTVFIYRKYRCVAFVIVVIIIATKLITGYFHIFPIRVRTKYDKIGHHYYLGPFPPFSVDNFQCV